jgi:hypothetical protein
VILGISLVFWVTWGIEGFVPSGIASFLIYPVEVFPCEVSFSIYLSTL